jgi:hypothetical protein
MERNKRLIKNDAMRRIFRPTQISDDVINRFSDLIEYRLRDISSAIHKSNRKRITIDELLTHFGFALDANLNKSTIKTEDFE